MHPTCPGPIPAGRPSVSVALRLGACLAFLAGLWSASAGAGDLGDLPPGFLAPAPPARQAAPDPAPADGTTPSERARFEIELQAPQDISRFLLRHMDLQRFRLLDDLDAAELDRLLARTPENLRSLLGTLGHFAPDIEVGVVPGDGLGKAPLGTVRISVDPGPATRVASARVFFRGDVATNAASTGQRSAIEREVALPVGEPFTQADWEQTKTRVLRLLTAERYPNGRLLNSLADIDAESHQAHLYMELDSGPLRRLGAIEISGAQRYDAAQVEQLARLAGVEPGADYSLDRLQAAQVRIAGSDRYESVLVTVEPAGDETELPVRVQLRERQRQKLQIGLGGSTDNGPRLSLEYRHQQVPGIGWRVDNRVQLERSDKLAQTVWTGAQDEQAWRWAASARWAEQSDGFNTTTSQRLRWGRSQEEGARDQGQYLQFDRARTVNSSQRSLIRARSRSALSVNQAWTWRQFDNPVFPERGQGLALELGVGATLEGTPQPFARAQARWLTYWPLGGSLPVLRPEPGQARSPTEAAEQGRLGRLALRLEGGAVLARRETALPDTQLFLAGGDASVRGYGLRDIGVDQGDGRVSPGRYLAVASVEWQRPIWRGGRPTPWEHVLFVDGGGVADRRQDLRAQWGVGSGVRYNSPVGPLQVDLAYGLATRSWRLHLSVGFAF
jgi:translocation and assembly module TamA